MYEYKVGNWRCISENQYPYEKASQGENLKTCYIYNDSRKRFPAIAPMDAHFQDVLEHGVRGLYTQTEEKTPCEVALNLAYFEGALEAAIEHLENWQRLLQKKKRIHLLGLGDVGATLAIGLKLIDQGSIEYLGIYDLNPNSVNRWEMELNQILDVSFEVRTLEEHELMDCDVFLFCASKAVPKVGDETKDVRMVQFEENAKIAAIYAQKARETQFKGLFCVVSDPVDLLCKKVYETSHLDPNGLWDGRGLFPEQVRGFGLGVMHGRALYYSRKEHLKYETKGRVFGPHGSALVVIEDIEDETLKHASELTRKVTTSNLQMREWGYKPYVAPALSSGAKSILASIDQEWHYSASYVDGVFWGTKQKMTPNGTVFESIRLSDTVFDRVYTAYRYLEETWETLHY